MFYLGFIFTVASPIIFHSHRHLMFVNYMAIFTFGAFWSKKVF